jgi:hypothetical protein
VVIAIITILIGRPQLTAEARANGPNEFAFEVTSK